MKSITKNILRPFLFISLGLAITTVFASTAPFDVPGRPGKPCIDDYSETGCLLNYLPPRSDGGSSITGYFIECKMISWGWDNWQPKGTSRTLSYYVQRMKEGSEAIFRVSAENLAGIGRPSDSSYPVVFEKRVH